LSTFLEKPKKIKYFNKIQGYGLKDSDFDSYKPDCSRRVFNYRKIRFLKSRIIEPLKSKGRKTRYYSITPLGIAFLFHMNVVDFHQFNKIFEFISRYVDEGWLPYDEVTAQNWGGDFELRSFKKFSKNLDEKLLCKIIQTVLRDVKIVNNEKNYYVYLTQTLPKETNCVLWKFTIKGEKVYLNFDPKWKYRNHEVDVKNLYSTVAVHILESFHFLLMLKLEEKHIQNYYREDLEGHSEMHGISIMHSTATSLEEAGLEF